MLLAGQASLLQGKFREQVEKLIAAPGGQLPGDVIGYLKYGLIKSLEADADGGDGSGDEPRITEGTCLQH